MSCIIFLVYYCRNRVFQTNLRSTDICFVFMRGTHVYIYLLNTSLYVFIHTYICTSVAHYILLLFLLLCRQRLLVVATTRLVNSKHTWSVGSLYFFFYYFQYTVRVVTHDNTQDYDDGLSIILSIAYKQHVCIFCSGLNYY